MTAQPQPTLFRRLLASSWAHAAFAFTLMGSWAFFANRLHPMPAPLIAAVVQGIISASIATMQKWAIDRIYARTPNILLCILAGITISFVVITSAHWLAGTPEILATIVVPWLIGVFYVSSYTLAKHRVARS